MLRTASIAASTAIALCAARQDAGVALCAAVGLPEAADAAEKATAPEWVHLLPAGEIRTGDGRGPYLVRDAAGVIAASLQAMGNAGVIDENHSTDLAAPRGEPAPARGWIRELQARADGIWARVDWTAQGARLVAGKAYRGLSPVINHLKDGTVTAILRASLVNKPNLRGLAALHQETDMDLLAKLLAALGLPETTSEETLLTAVTTLHAQQKQASTALQAQLAPIAKAAGLAETADAAAVLAGVERLKSAAPAGDVVTALQAEIATLATSLKTLQETGAKARAETFVDAAIAAQTVGVKPLRDHYVARHMQNPAEVEKEIGAFPRLGLSNTLVAPPAASADGSIALNAEQSAAAKALGIDPKKMAETLKAEREAAL